MKSDVPFRLRITAENIVKQPSLFVDERKHEVDAIVELLTDSVALIEAQEKELARQSKTIDALEGTIRFLRKRKSKAPRKFVPEPRELQDVHTEHCCREHGCKYGNDDCPVARGKKRQSYHCEWCRSDYDDLFERKS